MTPPSLMSVPDPQTCQDAALRDVLEVLLEALAFERAMPPETPNLLRYIYDAGWAIDNAYTVLAQDPTGREAQQEIRLHLALALLAYEFSTYLLALQKRGVTHPAEIQDALEKVARLTQESDGEDAHA